jgi:CheY-like chemotaxis protein
LGLAIVERMTKRLGYRIEPCSIQGKGSRFRLILPLTQAQEHSSTPTLLASSSSGFNGLKTLIMDNDANVLTAMDALLQSWQCQTHTCRNLAQALHAPFQAQLVLADYQLDNDENGLDALIALQKEWGNTMAGILISATPSARIEEKAKELGFYFLRKPIKPAALRALLRRISRT